MSEEFIKTIASLVGISTVAAISRAILTPDRRSFTGFVRAIFLAIFVGAITSGILQSYTFSPGTQGAIVGLCSFVADDILLSIIALSSWFRADPSRIINIILNRKTGD